MAKKKQSALTPAQVAELIDKFGSVGISIQDLASELGVSFLYASRLSNPSYWSDGFIPEKTSKLILKLKDKYLPEAHTQKIIETADTLGKDDLYYIHSARSLLEFTNQEVRSTILSSAARGVKIFYLFPNVNLIFDYFGSSSLELAQMIPSDLQNRYRFLMQTLSYEAKESGLCSQKDLRSNVTFQEHLSGFLFSPWNKLVYYRMLRDGKYESLLIQEHHSLDPKMAFGGSSFNWSCTQDQAEKIGKILMSGKHTPLHWEEIALPT